MSCFLKTAPTSHFIVGFIGCWLSNHAFGSDKQRVLLACVGLGLAGIDNNCGLLYWTTGFVSLFCGLMFIFWAVGWISLSDEDNLYGWY